MKALLLIDDTEWDTEKFTQYGCCLVNLERHNGILYWVKEKALTFKGSLEDARIFGVKQYPDLCVLGGVWKRTVDKPSSFPDARGSVKYEDYPL